MALKKIGIKILYWLDKKNSTIYMKGSLGFKMLVILGSGWLGGPWRVRKRQPLEAS